MHPPCCWNPSHTFCTHLHPQPSADSPYLPSHLSPGNRLWQGHALLPMLASHPLLSPPPPPRLKRQDGACPLPSTPTALAPSLPPQAPLTTLAPVNYRMSVLAGLPHSVQPIRLGPRNEQYPGHGGGAGTGAESGLWLPTGQFQDMGPPPLLCHIVQPQEQLKS